MQNLTGFEKIDIILDCIIAKGSIAFLAFCDEKIDQSYLVAEVLGLKIEDIRQQRGEMALKTMLYVSYF